MRASFLWHDYETFGANVRVDRPAEFACWRSNEAFEPISEPVAFRCRPTLDYLPQPQACVITGIGPESAWREGLTEPEFAERVLAEMGTPQTCVLGYNSMRFDDEITRYLFWRNFIDPYQREWANGNSRFDLIDLARAAQALRPAGIHWPKREDGHPSFRLSDLSAANALPHRHAHAALSDVEATLALARLIRASQPRLMSFALGLRRKARVLELLDWRQRTPVVHVSQRFPAERGCLAQVVPLAMHPSQSGKVIVVDAYQDPAPLLQWTAEKLADLLLKPASDPDHVALGLKLVHANRAPFVAPLSVLEGVDLQRIAFDRERVDLHTRKLQDAPALDQKLQQVYALLDRGERPVQDPDEALYAGFLADGDRALCTRWRGERPEELQELSKNFTDPRLQALAFRYRARHHEPTLSEPERKLWLRHCRDRLNSADGTLEPYMSAVRDISTQHPELSSELTQWAQRLCDHAQIPWPP